MKTLKEQAVNSAIIIPHVEKMREKYFTRKRIDNIASGFLTYRGMHVCCFEVQQHHSGIPHSEQETELHALHTFFG